jgi:hypothetical protein
MKKYTLSLVLAIGLLLAGTLAAVPARAQEDLNPGAELAKFVTPPQKKKLDAIQSSLNEAAVGKIGLFQSALTKKLYELAMGPTYQPEFAEAEKLSEPEQGAKKKEIWKKIAEEVRPPSEKELTSIIRGLVTGFFADAEKIMTVAQKPKFLKVKTQAMAALDKELLKTVHTMYDSLIPVKE